MGWSWDLVSKLISTLVGVIVIVILIITPVTKSHDPLSNVVSFSSRFQSFVLVLFGGAGHGSTQNPKP